MIDVAVTETDGRSTIIDEAFLGAGRVNIHSKLAKPVHAEFH